MIVTNQLDKNTYNYNTLNNDAKLLFIQKILLDKSAISISVKTGSLNDTLHGIAHFLEHMLFMGTEKYPKENEFSQYLSQHNGSYNAITYDDLTVYFFEIDPKYFINCLQIFSRFFVSPLFDPSCLEREICAVDSEFKMNYRNDLWRIERLASKFSIFDAFGVGNKDTLDHKNIREIMMDFYKNNYSSDKMNIVVYHNEDITDFLVNEFKDVKKGKCDGSTMQHESIKNNTKDTSLIDANNKLLDFDAKNNTYKSFTPSLYSKPVLNKMIYVESIKDVKELQIRIEVPKVHKSYKNKSYEYIKFVVLNKNKNSLIDRLKKEGYSYDLSFSYEVSLYFSVCKITVNLTEKGYKKVQNVLELVKNELQYCEVSKSKYEMIKETESKNFKYKETINACDYVLDLSYDMQYYPIENVLNHEYVYEEYNQEEIEGVLKILRDSNNWLVFLVSQDIENNKCTDDIKRAKTDENNNVNGSICIEEYYKTKYLIGNEIVLKDEIRKYEEKDKFYSYTFVYNNDYKIPKSIVTVKLNKKIENNEMVGYLFYLECLNDVFFEKYDDFLYFNSIELNSYITKSGVEIKIEGFNTKIEETLQKYINEYKQLSRITIETSFDIIKEKLINRYIKIKNKQSFRRLYDFYNGKIFGEMEVDEIISEIQEMKVENIKIYNKCFVDVFVTGNEDFKSITKMLCDCFEKSERYNMNDEEEAYKSVKNKCEKTGSSNISDKTHSKNDMSCNKREYNKNQIDYTLSFTSEDKQNNSVGLFIDAGVLNNYKNIAANILTI
ncbi:hypothetical protein BDAP_001080 [Binucleata daphniae]